jgi:hypothetical protein
MNIELVGFAYLHALHPFGVTTFSDADPAIIPEEDQDSHDGQ